MTAAPKAISLAAMLFAPSDLQEADQWVLWRRERDTKVPYQPNGKRASSTDLKTWRPYIEVYEAWQKYPNHWEGIGFTFSEHDPFCGIDLDDCLDADGNIKPWAQPVIERFADTYQEVSPSGTGIKIFCRGKLPTAVVHKIPAGGAIEMYDRGRYFTVTGKKWGGGGAPDAIEDHAADLLVLHAGMITRCQPQYVAPEGKIKTGNRHRFLVSIAGTLRRRNVCEEGVAACLQAINKHQFEEPRTADHVAKIVASSRPWRQPE